MRFPRSIAWGVFCASSWAWCIGLFLPVVLRRLLGWPGFLAFAIPNVVGCTAFGFTMNRRRSRAMRRDHAPAMRLFSAVTIAYQLLLAGWTGAAVSGLPPASGAMLGLVVVVGLVLLQGLPERVWPAIAIGAWLASVTALVSGLAEQGVAALPAPELPPAALWGLLPALLLGFLLCPYLDLSFHRALRRGSPRPTFLAFGATFALLIVLVAFLADAAGPLGLAFTPAVLAALWVQLGFTSAVHAREIRLSLPRSPAGRGRAATIVAAAVIAGTLLGLPMLASEATYLRMLGWYGLAFPAYMLIAVIGAGGAPTHRVLVLLAVALGISLPFFEWGLTTRQFGWMAIPALPLVVLALWLRATRRPRDIAPQR